MQVKSWPSAKHPVTEKQVDGYPVKVYQDRPYSLREILQNTARRSPDKVAFIFEDQQLTYQAFTQKVNRISSALQSLCQIKKGARVALLFTNTLEFCVCYFAITQLGAVCVPLNYRLSSREFEYLLQDTGARAAIIEGIFWDRIEPIRSQCSHLDHVFISGPALPDGMRDYQELEAGGAEDFREEPLDEEDLASIMYTSGTTGLPKGAMMCHRNLLCNAITATDVMELSEDTRQMVVTPLFHASALHSQLIPSILNGGSCVIMKEFKTLESLALMAKEKVNLVIGVPTMYWFWVNSPDFDNYDLSAIQYTISGAAAAAPELIKKLAKKFPNSKFVNAGGMTETTSLTYALPPEAALTKLGSIGWATPCMEIMVVDEEGQELPLNESGEFWFKGAALCKGYWNKPEANKASFTRGWIHTGDIGKVDEDGYLFILDRKKDMIIRGGENIYCVEVENVLYSHPKVLEAAVVGVPDKIYGEQVKAVLVLKPGKVAEAEEIQAFCSKSLAEYKVPKQVSFTDVLPRNPGGKVLKTALREQDQS